MIYTDRRWGVFLTIFFTLFYFHFTIVTSIGYEISHSIRIYVFFFLYTQSAYTKVSTFRRREIIITRIFFFVVSATHIYYVFLLLLKKTYWATCLKKYVRSKKKKTNILYSSKSSFISRGGRHWSPGATTSSCVDRRRR